MKNKKESASGGSAERSSVRHDARGKKHKERHGSRMGLHREDKINIGLYVDTTFRALVAFLVDKTGDTATDIMMDGVRMRAVKEGVIVNGLIAPEYRAAIAVIREGFEIKIKNKKGNAK